MNKDSVNFLANVLEKTYKLETEAFSLKNEISPKKRQQLESEIELLSADAALMFASDNMLAGVGMGLTFMLDWFKAMNQGTTIDEYSGEFEDIAEMLEDIANNYKEIANKNNVTPIIDKLIGKRFS